MPLRICNKNSLGETACFETREDCVRIVLTLLGISEHFKRDASRLSRRSRKILNLGTCRLGRSCPGRLDVAGLCLLRCWSKRKLQWTILMRNSSVRLAIPSAVAKPASALLCSKEMARGHGSARNSTRRQECKKERVTIATDIMIYS